MSQLDKVKNYLIYYNTKNNFSDLGRIVNKEWGRILHNLNACEKTSNDDENAFLRNCWIVFKNPIKSESYNVYENLKKVYPSETDTIDISADYKNMKAFIIFIKNASLSYLKLFKQEHVDGEEKECLQLISLQSDIASVIPLILAVFAKEGDKDTRTELFRLIEKLNFRYYGCDIAGRTDTGQGELFGYAHKYFNDHLARDEDQTVIDSNWLIEKLTGFIKRNAQDSIA